MTVASRTGPAVALEPLVFRRMQGAAPGAGVSATLGGRCLGTAAAALSAPLLAAAGAVFGGWSGAGPARHRVHGRVRSAADGAWQHGVAEVDEHAGGLQDASRRAHAGRDLQFNAARQQASIDARRSRFQGGPAACALGMPSCRAESLVEIEAHGCMHLGGRA